MNVMLRLLRKQLRASVHPVDAIERVVREHGLAPHITNNVGAAWQVAIYRRL